MCERIHYLILPMRQLSHKPLEVANALNNPTIHRSDTSELSGTTQGPSRIILRSTASEPLGKTPGPSYTLRRSAAGEPSGSTPGPSRIEPSAEAIHKRVVGQYARPVSNRTICQSNTCKLSGSHKACTERPPTIRRESHCRRTADKLSRKPPGSCWASTVYRAIRRAIRCCGPAAIEPNPLDYSL